MPVVLRVLIRVGDRQIRGDLRPLVHANPTFEESCLVPHRLARAPLPDTDQKQAALGYLNEAWAEARHDGVDGDCLAQASLFAALAELVGTYGEDAVAKFMEGIPVRVRNGEYSLTLARQ